MRSSSQQIGRKKSAFRRLDRGHRGGRAGALLLFFLLAAAAGPVPIQAAETISSACEPDYPPFSVVDEAGRPDGFSVELLRAAVRAMGREVAFRTGPWAEVKAMLERGEVQALPLVGRTPEREAVFDFTVPYLSLHGAIVVREETEDIRDFADLRGRSVAVMKGDNAEEFLRRSDAGIDIRTTASFDQALEELSEGRHDAVVVQRLLALRLIRQAGIRNLRVLDRPLTDFRQDFCFAVREGDAATLSLLNEGLALVIADGTFRLLHSKWFAALELSSRKRIVVGGDRDYPPYEFLDESGKPAGFLVELTRAVAREAGLDAEIRLGPWAEVRDGLEQGRIDAVQGMLYTPRRDLLLDFSPPHTVIQQVAVVRRSDGPPPATVPELAGKRIVLMRGDVLHDFALENGLAGRLTAVESLEDALGELSAGRHDCALVPRLPALHFIRKNGWDNLIVGRKAFLSPEGSFAVPSNRKVLLARLSEGLKAVEETGEFRRIQEKWLGVYEDLPPDPAVLLKYGAMVFAPLCMVVLILFFRARTVRTAERRAAAGALRESQARFKAVYDAMPLYLALWRRRGDDFVLEDVNPATVEFSGGRIRERLGTPLTQFYADTPWIVEAVERCHREGVPIGAESEYRLRSTREVKHLNFRFVPVPPNTVMAIAEDITERKRTETALAKTLRDLHLAQRIAKIGNWTFDPEIGRPEWSEEVHRIYRRDPALGPPEVEEYRTILRGRHWETFSAAFGAAVAEGKPYEIELEANLADGAEIWVLAICEPDPEPGPMGHRLRGTIQDITERRRTEAALRESEARFSEATRAGQVTVWEWDLASHRLRHDPLFWRNIGYAPETAETSGLWRRIIHPDDIDAVRNAARACVRGEASAYEMEHRVVDRDGRVRWVFARGRMKDGADRMVGTVQDVSERKEAELALAESEENYRRLTEMAPVGTAVLLEKRIVFANERAARIFGRAAPEALLGETPENLVREADRPSAAKNLRTLMEDRRPVPWVERRIRRPDGTEADVEITAVPIVYQGQPAIQACMRDVSERKRMEAEQREMERRVEAARRHESLATMAGAIAHNFNNILMAVLGNLDMALEDYPPFDPAREMVDEARQAAHRAAKLSRLMNLYVGHGQDVHGDFCLLSLIRSHWGQVGRETPDAISLVLGPDETDSEFPIQGDAARIFEAVLNLVHNAVEAIGDGAGEIRVRVSRETVSGGAPDGEYAIDAPLPGEYVVLSVSDDGPGMARDIRRRVFEPFFTTKFTGRGLGLAVVLGIVRGHRGAVRVRSEEGAGTAVALLFPAAGPSDDSSRR